MQGLPPTPADADPSNPEAPAPAPPQSRAVDRSAFEGVPLSEGGHDHHQHGKKGGER